MDFRTSHAVADVCETVVWCLCAYSHRLIGLWKNCSENEICLSVKQNILLAHGFLVKPMERPASSSQSLQVCLDEGYLQVQMMLS